MNHAETLRDLCNAIFRVGFDRGLSVIRDQAERIIAEMDREPTTPAPALNPEQVETIAEKVCAVVQRRIDSGTALVEPPSSWKEAMVEAISSTLPRIAEQREAVDTFIVADRYRKALEAASKMCDSCHGSGVYEPHCYKCDDSGEDHIDCPPSRPCLNAPCVIAREALKEKSV
jgi:hypothetical protein